jgi:predicted permease
LRANLFSPAIAVLFGGILIIFAAVGLIIRLYFFFFRFSSRGFALPSLFMNAGNMGIPLALFAFGQPGLQRATLMFVSRDQHVDLNPDDPDRALANSLE